MTLRFYPKKEAVLGALKTRIHNLVAAAPDGLDEYDGRDVAIINEVILLLDTHDPPEVCVEIDL